jgi:hypothetical protein
VNFTEKRVGVLGTGATGVQTMMGPHTALGNIARSIEYDVEGWQT